MQSREKGQEYVRFTSGYLGSLQFSPGDFSSRLYAELQPSLGGKLSAFAQHEIVNRALFEEIKRVETPVFLLPKIVSFITRIEKHLPTYNLASFEFWLTHYSGISSEERLKIRAKIVGKYVPRGDYQRFFPIGGGARYNGPHYSFAHYSPDLDTTVASFSSFLAAFAAEVGDSRHHWVVPGGAPSSVEIEIVFRHALGQNVFTALASTHKKAVISSMDLLTQKNMIRKRLSELSYEIDGPRIKKAVVLVDDEGCYLGDWRISDIEAVRGVLTRYLGMISEHRNYFQAGIIALFAKKSLKRVALESFIEKSLNRPLHECVVAREFTSEQRGLLDRFMKRVLFISKGYGCSYGECLKSGKEKFGFDQFIKAIAGLSGKDLFPSGEDVIEDRGVIFNALEEVLRFDQRASDKYMHHLDSLEVALKIKSDVFGLEPNYISHLSDVDEILSQIGDYHHMTVNYEEGGKLFPLGVIRSEDLRAGSFATASWNDFSNPGETDSRSEIQLISFIDHHKMEVKTKKPVTGIVRDAQSSNSIIANLTMEINDIYSSGGMTIEEIDSAIKEQSKNLEEPSQMRILERLLQKKRAMITSGDYFVSYEREILEYTQYLYAILDDTDILTKVTEYDVRVVCQLLNRLKSMMLREEVEIVNFDDLNPENPNFVQNAAKKLLQTNDLYSIYSGVCKAKEEAFDQVVINTVKGFETPFFQDTKVLGGGHVVVSQIKHFVKNNGLLKKKVSDLREIWIAYCKKMAEENPELSLFIFMMTTIASAEELFADAPDVPNYKDELWFWFPEGQKKGAYLLKEFIEEFHKSPVMHDQALEVEFLGKSGEHERAFAEAIQRPYQHSHSRFDSAMSVLKVDQKSINSRKAHIAVHL